MGTDNTSTGSAQGAAQTAESSLQTALAGQQTAAGGQSSVQTGNPQTTTPASDAGESLSAWTAQLTKETRGKPEAVKELSRFKTIDELANSYIELSQKSANMAAIPGKEAKPEEVEALYKKLGMPESSDKYSFLKNYNAADAADFAAVLHKARLSDEQAQMIVDHSLAAFEAAKQGQGEALRKRLTDSEAVLKKEYGTAYEEKIAHFTRALNIFGGDSVKKLLAESGIGYDADVVKMFVKIGEQFAESKSPSASAAPEEKSGMFSFKGVS